MPGKKGLLESLKGLLDRSGKEERELFENIRKSLEEYLEDVSIERVKDGGGLRISGKPKSELYESMNIYLEDPESQGSQAVFQAKFTKNPLLTLKIVRADVLETMNKDVSVHDFLETGDPRFDATFLMRGNQEFRYTKEFRELMEERDVESLGVDNREVSMEARCGTGSITDFLDVLIEFGKSVW